MWLYYWGMTDRQIEMLLADQPLVVYDHSDKGKGGKKTFEPVVNTLADVKEAEARFAQKHGVGGTAEVRLNLGMFGKKTTTNVDVK